MSLYIKRALRFEFKNETSSFDKAGNNLISISEARATVSLQSSGNLFGTQVNISIFGLDLDMLATLSAKAMGFFGTDTERISMKIFVESTAIFVGYMTSSIANMSAVPNAALMITATANADLQNKTASPFSFKGATPVTSVINAICKAAGYKPNIVGLEGKVISNPHYEGSVFDQLRAVCDDLKISMSVAPPSISFWPQESTRDSVKPFISPKYGLIGYPVFSNGGVIFQTQFSTLLTTGRDIELKTALPHVGGIYRLTSVTHELSSWMEDGPWHSVCIANKKLKEASSG